MIDQRDVDPGGLHTPHRVDETWIGDVLDAHVDGARVAGISVVPVGTGQVASAFRIGVEYAERPPSAPTSFVLKCPSPDPATRDLARRTRSYEVEVMFYRLIAPTIDVRVPRCWAAELDEETGRFALLLEDASPNEPGDQLKGLIIEEARSAVRQLAALHAAFWGHSGDDDLSWVRQRPQRDPAEVRGEVEPLVNEFVRRYGDQLRPETKRLCTGLEEDLARYSTARWSGRTLVHGDHRADNLLFGPGSEPPVVVDWGGLGEGAAMSDVGYFLGGSLLRHHRREAESDLVGGYWDELVALGVDDLPWDECWRQYRIHAFSGLSMAVLASVSVRRTPRGDQMFVAMAERHADQIYDHDAVELLRAHT